MASFFVRNYSRHLERYGSTYINLLRKNGICYPPSAKFLSLHFRALSSTCIQFTQMPAKSNDPESQKDTTSTNSDPSTAIPSSTLSFDPAFHPPSPTLTSNIAPTALPIDPKLPKSSIARQNSSIDINSLISNHANPAANANNGSPSLNLNASISQESEKPYLVESSKSPSEGDIGKELAGALNPSNLLLFSFSFLLDFFNIFVSFIDEVLNLLSRFYRLPEIKALAKETGLDGDCLLRAFIAL